MRAGVGEAIRSRALAMGFDAIGFATAHLAERARADLGEFLARGYHGDMGWLADTAARRGDPQTLWSEAKTVIVLGPNYGSAHDPLTPPSVIEAEHDDGLRLGPQGFRVARSEEHTSELQSHFKIVC